MSIQNSLIVGVICLSLGAAGGGRLAWVHQDGKVQRAQNAQHEAERIRDSWITYGKGEKSAFDQCEATRTQEHKEAVQAVSEQTEYCVAQVKAARSSDQAIRSLLNRPVKLDAKGCPARTLATEKELQPLLRPEVK